MLNTVDASRRAAERVALRSMFEARKRVFVDLLRWELPVLSERYELDQFDDAHATYLIIADAERRHLGSVRLLETVRPHILDTLFPDLAGGGLPRGPDVREITRFCLSPELCARKRRRVRDQLVTAIGAHALVAGIRCYTGVAELPWLRQILAFGWDASMLAERVRDDGRALGALRIDIGPDVLARLAAAGIYAEADAEASADAARAA